MSNFKIFTLNFISQYTVQQTDSNWTNFYNSLNSNSFSNAEDVSFESATLYKGNALTTKLSRYANETFSGSVTDTNAGTSLMCKFSGYINFSVFLKVNGNIRISTKCPYELQQTSWARTTEEFMFMMAQLCEELFDIEIDKSDLYPILINGILYKEHYFTQRENDVQYLKDTGLFKTVLLPNFDGGVRRKGAIKMNPHNVRSGTIVINNASFQLLGFRRLIDIDNTLRAINDAVSLHLP